MTEHLYHSEPYTASFEANVVERLRDGDRLTVVLDRTCFYPTSGGQPCDLGVIEGIEVLDVFIRPEDGQVVHVLAHELWADRVQASIDWRRRFDHMQQHTGQHILSAAFLKTANADTIGFHLGAASCTIDLDIHHLPTATVSQVEDLANEVVFANRTIKVSVLTPMQLAELPVRKRPEIDGPMRIVEIDGFDTNACGGTHVKQTGEVGTIKILGLESRTKGLRIEFACGRRALSDYLLKDHLIRKVANDLTVGYWEVPDTVSRMRGELKTLRSAWRKASEELQRLEAEALLNSAEENRGQRIISAVFQDRDTREINGLARSLSSQTGVIVLFGVAGAKSHILFARAQDVEADMRELLKTALRVLGSTSGGGRPELAQGGGPAAEVKRMQQAIDRAKRLLMAQRS